VSSNLEETIAPQARITDWRWLCWRHGTTFPRSWSKIKKNCTNYSVNGGMFDPVMA